MSTKQARLIAAIKDALADQGVTVSEMARASGSSISTISGALSGKTQMRDERWRMCCEHLHLDYDEIIADMPQKNETEEQKMEELPDMETVRKLGSPMLRENEKLMAENEQMRADNMVLAAYAAKHIREDIKKGMDIGIQDLRILLNAVGMYIDTETKKM